MGDWTDAIEQMVRAERLVEEYDRDGKVNFAPPRPPAVPEQ